ncbi:MAG: hypothetical protein DELT_02556 [Desulfovibrio sp.]
MPENRIEKLTIGKVVSQLAPGKLTQAVSPLFAVYRARGMERDEALGLALDELLWLEQKCQSIGERENPSSL